MIAPALALAVVSAAIPASPVPSGEVSPETVVHLGISLAITHRAELNALLQAQQDPSSPAYRRWLTPAEFGDAFGQPTVVYAQVAAWLKGAGLEVTESPGHTFIEGLGTAAAVERLLGVKLLGLIDAPVSVHVPDRALDLPKRFANVIVNISGLDTRFRFQHRFVDSQGDQALGPQDVRLQYDLLPLFDAGFVGQGQQTVVLSTALTAGNAVSLPDVAYFLSSISDSVTPVSVVTLPNPQNDVDAESGANTEFELDLEMQSVGNAGGEALTLLVSPASEVFTTGAAYIANSLPTATSVSVSLGTCEPIEAEDLPNEPVSLQASVLQGLAEGQTWFAASGDSGADDCQGLITTTSASVDFPASLPQFVAMGGSQIAAPAWNAANALTAVQPETVWNGGQGGGAGGGGVSTIFPEPSYQVGLPFPDSGRLVPDLSLIAGYPGVVLDSNLPGQLTVVGGTSVASPLSAGFFALIASRVGCRLGDIHQTLYTLGQAQLDGGAQVFHDITSGNNAYDNITGFSAGAGYDPVSGWGSLDVSALAAVWPACPDGGVIDAGPSYSQCGFLACDGGAQCVTLAGGPSACVAACDPSDAGSCPSGSICSGATFYSGLDAGQCIPGCLRDSDCGDGGSVCSLCLEACVPAGDDSAKVGDACTDPSQCPSGGLCETGRFDGGYCSFACTPGEAAGSVCGCPSGSYCADVGNGGASLCVETCDNPQGFCARPGYICQESDAGPACLPPCRVTTRGDTCLTRYGSDLACEPDSGICGGPIVDAGEDAGLDAGLDAGFDGGPSVFPDAGQDAGTSDAGPADAGTTQASSGGCSCTPGSGGSDVAFVLLALGGMLARRRRAR